MKRWSSTWPEQLSHQAVLSHAVVVAGEGGAAGGSAWGEAFFQLNFAGRKIRHFQIDDATAERRNGLSAANE